MSKSTIISFVIRILTIVISAIGFTIATHNSTSIFFDCVCVSIISIDVNSTLTKKINKE